MKLSERYPVSIFAVREKTTAVLQDGIAPNALGEAILAVLIPLVEKERG